MTTMTCFVAGAYSSKYGWVGRVFNVLKMFIYVRRIIKLGLLPIAPNVIYCLFASLQPRGFWLGGTQRLLQQCDILFLVPGWEQSEGARKERAAASKRNQPTFTSLDSLKDFREKSDLRNTESVTCN